MKKLLMTLGIIFGITAIVSAQSAEAKPAEALASKPETKSAPVKVVTLDKPVNKVAPVKVVTIEKPVAKETAVKAVNNEKPVTKTKIVRPAPVETGMQATEIKTTKEKENK